MAKPVDLDKLGRKTKPEILDAAMALLAEAEQEYTDRMRLQAESVKNLMGGWSPEEELTRLHGRIVDLETQLTVKQDELRRLRGEPTSATNTRTIR